jgi:hypothetical protein
MVKGTTCVSVTVGGVDESFRDCDCHREFLSHEIGDLGEVDLVDLKHGGKLVSNVIKFCVHSFEILLVEVHDVNQVIHLPKYFWKLGLPCM